VVWLSGEAIPGSPEAIRRLRDTGHKVVFVTNNSSAYVADQEAKLAAIGIDAEGDVMTSALAAASILEPGTSAVVCGGAGVHEALERRGVRAVDEGPADTVVVGFFREFDYERLRIAHHAVHHGARLVGTNDDPTLPSREGPVPGAGSLLAAVATAAGIEAEVAGKPYQPMVDLVRSVVGEGDHVVVGDRPTTDGRLAHNLGARFGLVFTGATSPDDLPSDQEPDIVADDLASLVEAELGAQ
jgi:HAD superfamily hydrolase (TIGR01450 family)